MFGFRRKRDENKCLLLLAEHLVPHASVIGLSLDKVLMTLAEKYRIAYPTVNPWFLFVYTMSGTAVAMLTAPLGVMKRVGLREFRPAVDRGHHSIPGESLMLAYSAYSIANLSRPR